MLASRLPCVSIAPFATPVVPPVYCSAAMLSSDRATCCVDARIGAGREPSRARRQRACENVVCAKVIGGIIFFTYFWTARTSSRLSGGSRSAMLTTTTVESRSSAAPRPLSSRTDRSRSAHGAAVGELVRPSPAVCRAGWCSPSPARPSARRTPRPDRPGSSASGSRRDRRPRTRDLAQVDGELVRERSTSAKVMSALRSRWASPA